MKQLMIPSIIWNNEYWCIEKGNNIKKINEQIKYYTGTIPNLILDLEKIDNIEEDIDNTFKKYHWINKIMIIYNKQITHLLERK